MISATIPFKADSEEESFKKVQLGDFKSDVPISVSPSAVDLLTRLLDPNPKTRITMTQLCQHPWMKMRPENVRSSSPTSKYRSDKRRLGKDVVRTCISRWW